LKVVGDCGRSDHQISLTNERALVREIGPQTSVNACYMEIERKHRQTREDASTKSCRLSRSFAVLARMTPCSNSAAVIAEIPNWSSGRCANNTCKSNTARSAAIKMLESISAAMAT